MDKKNTMLLTVIAVATLLVAVVGATFAYFTASATGSSSTTVTATTQSVAAVTLTNEIPTLHATLSAADFAQDEAAYKSYYATTSETANYDTEETLRNILKASTTDAAAKYTCTAKVLVSYSGATLQEGDAFIKFGGQLSSVGEVDLTKVSESGYDVTFNLDGASTSAQYVSAAVRFVNKNVEQNHLAGQTINVTIKTDTTKENAFKCTVVQ